MLASYHEIAATGAAGTGLVGSCAAPPLPASLRATASKMAATLAAVLADVSMKSMEFLQKSSHVMPLHAAGEHPNNVYQKHACHDPLMLVLFSS